MKNAYPITSGKHLGDFRLAPYRFPGIDEAVKSLKGLEKTSIKKQREEISKKLLSLIQEAPEGAFVLIAALEFIEKVHAANVTEKYTFSHFELWLNGNAGLSEEENYTLRGKLVGKLVPRNDYQTLFPVGMGKVHEGSHYVTAHASPDLDTTVASFWGWIDAFGARVSEGLHIWNVPGGPPELSIEIALLFSEIFGEKVFDVVAKTSGSLTLSGQEIMTRHGVAWHHPDHSSLVVDHKRAKRAVILVDDEGFFVGDWRNIDVEGVRQIVQLLNNCLRWFENNLHAKLMGLFGQNELTLNELVGATKAALEMAIKDSPPVQEFDDRQKKYVELYLQKVLGVSEGLNGTFHSFADSMQKIGLTAFHECISLVMSLPTSGLFDQKGRLIGDRPAIFKGLEKIFLSLDTAIQSVKDYTERLDVALRIKTEVFGYLPQIISDRAEVEEIKAKMGSYPYLTVTSSDVEGKLVPLGIVRSTDIHRPILGTVTLRDFCNRDETKIPSYFEVISVIDHHKSVLQTASAPVAYISDAQSSNSVVAKLAFQINDKYSTGGMTLEEIEKQIAEVQKQLKTESDARILRRLLMRRANAQRGESFAIDPAREFIEYLHFLYAIIDDTDLLTKVSQNDVEVVAEILNRMKSLTERKEVEIIHFDGIAQGELFVAEAASRILQHPDMYSLYKKIYVAKEALVEENLTLCSKGEPSSIFADTKLQNGCARVGQTKMFAKNFPLFEKVKPSIQRNWVAGAEQFFEDRRAFSLHIHMVSTIAGAEDLYTGTEGEYKHKDELWIWVPGTDQSVEHLKTFLTSFSSSPQMQNNKIGVTLQGEKADELVTIFKESFLPIEPKIKREKDLPTLAIIEFNAGTINSRKAMISPYLPQLLK